jgi:hypothetical protein
LKVSFFFTAFLNSNVYDLKGSLRIFKKLNRKLKSLNISCIKLINFSRITKQ